MTDRVWRTCRATIGGRENEGDGSYIDRHPRVPATVTARVNLETGHVDRTHREAAAGYVEEHPRTPPVLLRGTSY